MSAQKTRSLLPHLQGYIVTGALLLTPILVTWLVFDFLFTQLAVMGRPWVPVIFRTAYSISPELAQWLFAPVVEYILAVLLSLTLLYVAGWATTRVVGKRILTWVDARLDSIPLVKTIYGSTKMLLEAFQKKPQGVQRVVLINFPSSKMKTVGFVTRILADERTGERLAVVYVPTAPNPTSGYMEIVPLDEMVATDWTMDEAMRFIITGGTSAPDSIPFRNVKHHFWQRARPSASIGAAEAQKSEA